MKPAIILLLLTLGTATSVSAYQFSPPKTRASMDGVFTVFLDGVKSQCDIKAVVKTNADGTSAKITSFRSVTPHCEALNAAGLPWKVEPRTASEAMIVGFGYSSITATCGPTNLKATVDGSGQWTIHKKFISGGTLCIIDGAWKSAPPLTITQ